MNSIIVGIEVDDCLIEILTGQDILHDADHVAKHATLGCIFGYINEEDVSQFWRGRLVDSIYLNAYPVGPSTR